MTRAAKLALGAVAVGGALLLTRKGSAKRPSAKRPGKLQGTDGRPSAPRAPPPDGPTTYNSAQAVRLLDDDEPFVLEQVVADLADPAWFMIESTVSREATSWGAGGPGMDLSGETELSVVKRRWSCKWDGDDFTANELDPQYWGRHEDILQNTLVEVVGYQVVAKVKVTGVGAAGKTARYTLEARAYSVEV